MSPLFGKKKSRGKTVAIVDIENGSVGAALALLNRGSAPRLLGETRIPLPLQSRRDTALLARQTERALDEALMRVSKVAARLRSHSALAEAGEVAHVSGFFSIPWASMRLDSAAPDFMPRIQDAFRASAETAFGTPSPSLYPYGAAALYGASVLLRLDAPVLLCAVGGEATELLILQDRALKARATLPQGLHSMLRTIVAHGGVSPEEARSFLRLPNASSGHEMAEALKHAQSHFAEEFAEVAPGLLKTAPAQQILLMAPSPAEGWFGRALSEYAPLAEMFPAGSAVRTLRAAHVQPYLAGHGTRPDFPLMLEALFVDKKFSGV